MHADVAAVATRGHSADHFPDTDVLSGRDDCIDWLVRRAKGSVADRYYAPSRDDSSECHRPFSGRSHRSAIAGGDVDAPVTRKPPLGGWCEAGYDYWR